MDELIADIDIHVEPVVGEQWGYVALDPDTIEKLVRFALDAEAVVDNWTVVVVITSDDRLRQLHAQFMGVDEETDVMTFPYEASPADDSSGGDIVISLDRASENAASFGQSAAQEIAFLVVHGVLHLCGWDDADPADRARMLTRQEAIIAAFDASVG